VETVVSATHFYWSQTLQFTVTIRANEHHLFNHWNMGMGYLLWDHGRGSLSGIIRWCTSTSLTAANLLCSDRWEWLKSLSIQCCPYTISRCLVPPWTHPGHLISNLKRPIYIWIITHNECDEHPKGTSWIPMVRRNYPISTLRYLICPICIPWAP